MRHTKSPLLLHFPALVEVPAHAQVSCVPRAAERIVHAAGRGRADRDQRVDGPVRRLHGGRGAAGYEHDSALVAAAVLRDERRRELRVQRKGHQVLLPAVEREPPVQPARGAVRAHHLSPRGAQPPAWPQEQTRALIDAYITPPAELIQPTGCILYLNTRLVYFGISIILIKNLILRQFKLVSLPQ